MSYLPPSRYADPYYSRYSAYPPLADPYYRPSTLALSARAPLTAYDSPLSYYPYSRSALLDSYRAALPPPPTEASLATRAVADSVAPPTEPQLAAPATSIASNAGTSQRTRPRSPTTLRNREADAVFKTHHTFQSPTSSIASRNPRLLESSAYTRQAGLYHGPAEVGRTPGPGAYVGTYDAVNSSFLKSPLSTSPKKR
eukprot:TRINITY_DN3300_c0_g1_i1.p1 TRINITY_DN3300_c0_g1~~TRINITY_DN3300_c0_g1_i1.p1  ORF type:complete len:205 (+),score=11.21 TRINITY_DN3300_c0_g1_i1:24-617(+)